MDAPAPGDVPRSLEAGPAQRKGLAPAVWIAGIIVIVAVVLQFSSVAFYVLPAH